jgi:Putative Flp pilus-assembly TadE/G-like
MSRPPSPRGRAHRLPSDAERGAVAIIVAVSMVVMMGLAALVIDLGFARDLQRKGQNAADAGALAAAQFLSTVANPQAPTQQDQNNATSLAQQYISNNGWSAGADLTYDLVNFVVQVHLHPQTSPSFFSGAIGSSTPSLDGLAKARWAGDALGDCTICIFGNYGGTPNPDLDAAGGDIRIGGNLDAGPNTNVTADAGNIFVRGTTSTKRNTVVSPAQQPGGPVPDPFKDLPTPAPATQPITGSLNGNCAPGFYVNISCSGTLPDGVYVVTGSADFKPGTIIGNDVVLYFTCASGGKTAVCKPGQAGGRMTLSGTIDADLTADSNRPTQDIVIFFDRENTSTLSISGDVTLGIHSSIYLKSGTLNYGGRPGLPIDDRLVVGTITGNGNPAGISVTGDSGAIPNTGGGAAAGAVHLVP